MTREVIFISDFFVDEIQGGAEHCNEALMRLLEKDIKFKKIKTSIIDTQFVENNKASFFIVANFFLLPENIKKKLSEVNYAILEHDHKYVKSNNPSLYKNFLVPESQIQNRDFYKNAIAVLCQSKKHAEVLQKNLLLDNIANLGGNIWTPKQLSVLEKNINNKKTIKHGIIYSTNKNKGMPAAIEYCRKKNIEYQFVRPQPFEQFIENLSRVEKLFFFPQWLETYSRLCIEYKILGGKLVTNSLVGAASEDYFKLSGKELFDLIKENNLNLKNKWLKLISNKEIEKIKSIDFPKITVFCPLYKGEKYIQGYLEDIENQTIFNQCELIIIDANSPENEKLYIERFCQKYDNVIYKRLSYRASVMETENMALKMATGEYFAQTCVDDRHSADYLELARKHLYFRNDIDLVYADCLQTKKPNETFFNNSSSGELYQHSTKEYTKENMIKCLPGPMPVWKIKVHEKTGYFDKDLRYAGDWEMFLRMVDNGSKFKKIDIPLGLYYFNSEGLSTSDEYIMPRGKEEASVFFKYKHIFGKSNFNKYKNYFLQFTKE